ncbi:MAG: hypothetical protein JW915_16835 [Chitinispirillaceae bacterium]|nr:hypothetical protein [Chitinispirillaceae bacterium]
MLLVYIAQHGKVGMLKAARSTVAGPVGGKTLGTFQDSKNCLIVGSKE